MQPPLVLVGAGAAQQWLCRSPHRGSLLLLLLLLASPHLLLLLLAPAALLLLLLLPTALGLLLRLLDSPRHSPNTGASVRLGDS